MIVGDTIIYRGITYEVYSVNPFLLLYQNEIFTPENVPSKK